MSPSFSSFIILFLSLVVLNLFNKSTFIGKAAILDLKVSYCCLASTVVGAKYTTCLWSITALNAALIAISVLPYPTSPQSNLSIGFSFSISFFTSSIHRN